MGSLVSWGERTSQRREGGSPGVPEQDQPAGDGGGEGADGDVDMDKDEIDRLVQATKAKTEAQEKEDVNMSGERSNRSEQGQSSRPTPAPKATVEGAEKKKGEAEDDRQAEEEDEEMKRQEEARNMPAWATRIVPGCLIHSMDIAKNEDAIDFCARIIDNMIVTHLKARYRIFYLYMVSTPMQSYVTRQFRSTTRIYPTWVKMNTAISVNQQRKNM